MYGEIKGRLYVRVPAHGPSNEILRLEVVAPELARARYQGKMVLAERSAINLMRGTEFGSVKEQDVLGVEPISP